MHSRPWCNRPHVPNRNPTASKTSASAPTKPILGPSDKLALIFTAFDTEADGRLGYEKLCAFFSIVTRTNWDDRDAYEGWCARFGCDPNHGLPFREFAWLVTDLGGVGYAEAAFRHLGFESLGNSPPEDPADLRMELVRAAMDGLDGEALASLWPDDFSRAAAAEALGMDFRRANGNSCVVETGQVCASLPALLMAWQKFTEAAQQAVDQWRGKVKRHLEGAELDRMVLEWAMYDAAQGAGIASLSAQCQAARAFFDRMVSEPSAVGVWRLARAVADLQSTLEAAQAYGLMLPLDAMNFMDDVAQRIGTGDLSDLTMPPEGIIPAFSFVKVSTRSASEQLALRSSSSTPAQAAAEQRNSQTSPESQKLQTNSQVIPEPRRSTGNTTNSAVASAVAGAVARTQQSSPSENRQSSGQSSIASRKPKSVEARTSEGRDSLKGEATDEVGPIAPSAKVELPENYSEKRHSKRRSTGAVITSSIDMGAKAAEVTGRLKEEQKEQEKRDSEFMENAFLFEMQRMSMRQEANQSEDVDTAVVTQDAAEDEPDY